MKYIRLGLVLQFAYCNITYTDTEKNIAIFSLEILSFFLRARRAYCPPQHQQNTATRSRTY